VSAETPGSVLRRSLLAWGLGDLALGRRRAAIAWLIGEALGIGLIAFLSLAYIASSWYLLPFLAGIAFIVLWAVQAIAAYRRSVRATDGDVSPKSSPAAIVVLTIPLLVAGAGFWLAAGTSGSPDAVLDRFVGEWASVADGRATWEEDLTTDPADVTTQALNAVAFLRQLCIAGEWGEDCHGSATGLLRGIRVSIVAEGAESATATAETVRYEQRDSRFLGIFPSTELVPISTGEVLRLRLAAGPAPFGGVDWSIVSAEAMGIVDLQSTQP
jgi:hypothetical protein